MKKVKMFFGGTPLQVPAKIDEWQKANKGISIVSVKTKIAENRDTLVTVIYEEPLTL